MIEFVHDAAKWIVRASTRTAPYIVLCILALLAGALLCPPVQVILVNDSSAEIHDLKLTFGPEECWTPKLQPAETFSCDYYVIPHGEIHVLFQQHEESRSYEGPVIGSLDGGGSHRLAEPSIGTLIVVMNVHDRGLVTEQRCDWPFQTHCK